MERELTNKEFPCPCCGFLTMDEPPGSYNICEICGWEDDHVQLINYCLSGGANLGSLWYEQRRTLRFIPATVSRYNGVDRDSLWRPLTLEESRTAHAQIKNGMDYFNAACASEPEYYWLKSTEQQTPRAT